MAKKARAWTTKPTNFPARQCPKCGKYYHARAGECPNCGTANPTRGGAVRKTKRKVRRPKAARRAAARAGENVPLDAAIEFVQAAGGIENAKAALDTIERIRGL